MAMGERSGIVLGQIQRLFSRGTVSGLSEGQLLARFVGERDEVAFEAIVSRHGPMVLGICRRLLDDPHDVEDAFQATFLVLVKKARVLRDRDLLASWLYGVALRVATRSRRDRTRRRMLERPNLGEDAMTPADDGDRRELWSVIDAEVARLPAKFRTPIVLCYFEGLTHDQAAERMRCPVGTVRSRMTKGRELLRSRLTRRGLAPTPALRDVGPISEIAPAVPPALLFKTIAAAASVVAGPSIATGIVSTSAITLTQGVLRTMSLTKWMTLAAAVMVLGALGGGIGVAARQQGIEPASKEVQPRPTQSTANPARKALKVAQDGINEYEKQLKAAHAMIEQQHSEILALKARIDALESRGNAEAVKGPNFPSPWSRSKRQAPGDGPAVAPPVADVPFPDRITTSPGVIDSQSAKGDRVLIYVTKTGTARPYRPPLGAQVLSATVWQPYVLITSNGPGAAQLAAYDLDHDRWATQDLREGIKGGSISLLLQDKPAALVAPHFQGSPLTQLTVFDLKHFRWSVQDLIEPRDEGRANPMAQGDVAIYVLGRNIYAYSAEAGRWDVLNLDKPFVLGRQLSRATMPQV